MSSITLNNFETIAFGTRHKTILTRGHQLLGTHLIPPISKEAHGSKVTGAKFIQKYNNNNKCDDFLGSKTNVRTCYRSLTE